MSHLENISVSAEQRLREKQRGAWKVLMSACHENGIDTIAFANIIGISEGKAMMFFKQGSLEITFTDEQYERLGRATNHSAQFWKSLFTL